MIIKRKKYIYKPQFNYLGFMQRRKRKKTANLAERKDKSDRNK